MKYLTLKRRRDIRRQRLQFAAVLLTVVLGVMLFASTYDAYRNLTASYNGTYDRLAFADMTIVGGDPGLSEALRSTGGVAAVITRVQADVPLSAGDRTFVGRVVSVPTGNQPEIDRLDVVRGDYLASGAEDTALIETHAAQDLSLDPGESVGMITPEGRRELEIAGEVVSAEYLWPARSNQSIFEAPGEFGVLFVPESVVTAVAPSQVVHQTLVLYAEGTDRAELDAAVTRVALEHGAADLVTRADQPSNKALSLDVTGFEQMAVFFPAMFLLVAGMAAYTLLTRLVYSQRSQIGTLRANGFSRATVQSHYLAYGLWLGVAGALIGVALGVPLGWVMTTAYTRELGIPDTVRELRWITPVVGVAFGLVAGVVSAWVPARAAVRLRPADALRGDGGVARGGVSLLERLFPPLRRAAVHWRMVVRGIGRNRRRSLAVVVAITLALVLVLAAWGMVDTVTILLDKQFNQVQREDATLVPAVAVDPALLQAVASVPGVDSVEQVAALACSVTGPSGTYSTTLFAFPADTRMHGFGDAGGLPADGFLGGTALATQTGIETGDPLRATLTGADVSIEAPLAGFVDEPMGTPLYMAREALLARLAEAGVPDPAGLLSRPGSSLLYVSYADGADREATTDRLRGVPGIAAVSDSRALYAMVEDYLGLFYIFVGLMLVFGGVLALTLIFNIVSVNLAERVGELATMRANGMSRRRIGTLILAENMILTALGIAPGLLVGYAAAAWLMSTYTSDMLSFGLEMRPTTLVFAALAMFAVTALSLWPGMRALGRSDIATEVRERAA